MSVTDITHRFGVNLDGVNDKLVSRVPLPLVWLASGAVPAARARVRGGWPWMDACVRVRSGCWHQLRAGGEKKAFAVRKLRAHTRGGC